MSTPASSSRRAVGYSHAVKQVIFFASFDPDDPVEQAFQERMSGTVTFPLPARGVALIFASGAAPNRDAAHQQDSSYQTHGKPRKDGFRQGKHSAKSDGMSLQASFSSDLRAASLPPLIAFLRLRPPKLHL